MMGMVTTGRRVWMEIEKSICRGMLPYFVWEDSLVCGAGKGCLGMCLYIDVACFGLTIILQCLCIYLFGDSWWWL